MAFKIYRQGNFLMISDGTDVIHSKYAIKILIQPVEDTPSEFMFLYPDPYNENGTMREFFRKDISLLTDNGAPVVPFTKATFIEFYTTNTGEATTISPITPESGIQEFFIDTVGHVGSGVGWSDIGLIGTVPVALFDKNAEEAQVDTFKVMSRFLLADVNPIVKFDTYSTSLPVLTTGDSIRWQLEIRYIGEDELATKSPDETLLITQTFPYITANNRQDDLSFTLDRTLITLQDSIHMTLSRLAGDGADNYNADAGVSESVLSAEVTTFNP